MSTVFPIRLFAGLLLCAANVSVASLPSARSELEELLRDPTTREWRALSRFDFTVTRHHFDTRLHDVYDPGHGLDPYLRENDGGVAIYATPGCEGRPLAVVRFAAILRSERPLPVSFRSPEAFRELRPGSAERPLAGLRVAIEPADIGGRWAIMEDRSVEFHGFGRINEGDLNLIVAERLAEDLVDRGARVFLVRKGAQPVLAIQADRALAAAEELIRNEPSLVHEAFQGPLSGDSLDHSRRTRIEAGLLVTKTAETRARVAWVRRHFTPDLTIVLQHNATPESTDGRLTRINRNVFFINGAYTVAELGQPEQRFRLLTRLLEEVTPTETAVAGAIAARFLAVTGYPPPFSTETRTPRG
jgi:hypothetical protein